ncbi:MAG: hypothetical protein AB1630_08105 [bacterium]
MAEKKTKPISTTSTKQEILDAYNTLLEQIKERADVELKPDVKIEEKKTKEVIETAESLSIDGVVKEIATIKLNMAKVLTELCNCLEEEVNKYRKIKEAISVKEKELEEVYGIEKQLATMATLIEAGHQKHRELEAEISTKREQLTQEIEKTKQEAERQRRLKEEEFKEYEEQEKKRQKREREEYEYAIKREQQIYKDKFEEEKERKEKEISIKREEMERAFSEREKLIAEKEEELNELRKKTSLFPKEIEQAVAKAIKETIDKTSLEAKNKEELLKKGFEGEKNVFLAKIEAQDKIIKEQTQEIARLSHQLEDAYQKVSNIAIKSVEGPSYPSLTEQVKRQGAER